jgi:4-alpha-glucanotransferase
MAVLQFAFGGDSGNLYLPHNHHSDLVVYTGTHDNNTSVGWWQSMTDKERNRLGDYLGATPTEIHWNLIRLACASVADTAIYPLQDVLGLDANHRMNVPGHGDHCWRWRFIWEQFSAEPAERLASLCRLYRRDGTPLNY